MGLFTSGAPNTTIGRGSLISFNYPRSMSYKPNRLHDPTPILIISDIQPTYIRGVNLHYLTVPYLKTFLLSNGRNTNFNYATNIKPDKYLADSFRMYYRLGMQQQRKLDVSFLMQLLSVVRSFSPDELERIRNELRQQIQRRVQIKAAELNAYAEWQNQTRAKPMTQTPMQQSVAPVSMPVQNEPTVTNPNG
jgi:hypothetical protein